MLWLLILIGGVGALGLGFIAMRGPSPQKSVKRRVELIREHGIVRAVEVTCVCGERILLRCEYD